jgi:hypothetical protein
MAATVQKGDTVSAIEADNLNIIKLRFANKNHYVKQLSDLGAYHSLIREEAVIISSSIASILSFLM